METGYTIPKGSNSYCGPAALAYITRTDPDTAAYRFRKASGKRAIRGVTNRLMLTVLADLGVRFTYAVPISLSRYNPRLFNRVGTGTLKQWWLSTETEGLYLINITGHYIVLDGWRVFDNMHRNGISVHTCPYLRRRVKAAWRIER